MFRGNMLNEKANEFLYWNSPFYFRLSSFFVGKGYSILIRIGFFTIVKDSPLCERRSFSIANNIGNGEIFVIQFSRIMNVPVYLKQRIKEGVKNAWIREDRQFPRIEALFHVLSDCLL